MMHRLHESMIDGKINHIELCSLRNRCSLD